MAPDVVGHRPYAGRRPARHRGWKYYFSAESDGSLLREQYEAWHNEEANKRLVYYRLLIEAAEALLSIEFGKYINPKLPTPLLNLRDWTAIDADFCPNKTFYLQIYDPDQSFRFNYCEYVMARRLEPAEPGSTLSHRRDM